MSPGTRWRKRMKTRKSPIITQAAISSLDGRGLAGATTTGRGTIGLDVIDDDCKACVGQALSLPPDNLRGCPRQPERLSYTLTAGARPLPMLRCPPRAALVAAPELRVAPPGPREI